LIESVVDQSRSIKLNQANTVKNKKTTPHKTTTNTTLHKTTTNITPHKATTKYQKTQKKKLDLCDNHLFILKNSKKKGVERVILGKKMTQNNPSSENQEEREQTNKNFFSRAGQTH
jgi:hypothetical protein